MKLKFAICYILVITAVKLQSQSISDDNIKDAIVNILKAKNIPGGIVTVVSKDSILFQESFGISNLKGSSQTQKNSIFKIASLTKTFTAMAIIHLVQQGKLSLEDELKLIAPEIPIKNKWEETHPIKIKHLIEHTSGFSDYSYGNLAKRYKKSPTTGSFDELLTLENSLRSHWKPGLVTSYSNPGYTILGYIIEKISGISYRDYIKKEVLTPLGMTNTGFINHFSATQRNLIATGYSKIEGKIVATKSKKRAIGLGATGLLSTSDDMSTFLHYLLNKNLQQKIPLIGIAGVRTMENSHIEYHIENDIKTGYNLALEDRVFGEKEIVFKGNSGLTDGFVSNFIYNSELNIGVFVSTNLFGVSNSKIINLLVNHFCKSQEIDSVYKIENNDLSRFKDWEGEHRELNDSQQIWNFINFPFRSKTVEIKGNTLVVSDIENGAYEYKNVGGNAFLSEIYSEKTPTVYLTEYEGIKSIRYYDSTFLPTNKIWFTILRILILFSILILVITVLLFVGKLVFFPFVKSDTTSLLQPFLVALPFIFLLVSIYLSISNLSFERIPNLGRVSLTSISIYMLTILYPITCIWGIYSYLKQKKKTPNRYSKLFWSSALFSNIFICSYCLFMGWFAVKFWI